MSFCFLTWHYACACEHTNCPGQCQMYGRYPETTGEKESMCPTHSITLVATKAGLGSRTTWIFLELDSQPGLVIRFGDANKYLCFDRP